MVAPTVDAAVVESTGTVARRGSWDPCVATGTDTGGVKVESESVLATGTAVVTASAAGGATVLGGDGCGPDAGSSADFVRKMQNRLFCISARKITLVSAGNLTWVVLAVPSGFLLVKATVPRRNRSG